MLSIVIPAYNEESRLPQSLDKIEEFINLRNIESEIIVVVEKSTDRTLEKVKEYEKKYKNIRHLENDNKYGKGYSVKRGILASKGDYILMTDSDLSTPIEEIDNLITHISGYDCVIGDRIQLKKQPLHRIFTGYIFRLINYAVTMLPYRDTQCGFKMFTRKFAHSVFNSLSVNGFAFDVEILMLARLYEYRVKPVKVRWFNDENSKVDLVKDSIQMFKDLLAIRKRMKPYMNEGKHQRAIGLVNSNTAL